MTGIPSRRGMTLVELLVVIAVIGVLVALLLPAIQGVREAARRVQCKNHLHQLALAALNHHEARGHFPTGGWGAGWMGDRDRGFGEFQPGGWTYNLLPFTENQDLYDLAGDGIRDRITPQQLEGAKRLMEQAVAMLYCPSRRPPVPTPFKIDDHVEKYPGGGAAHEGRKYDLMNANMPELAGRVDYAINGGDLHGPQWPDLNRPNTMAEHESFPRCYNTLGLLNSENRFCRGRGSPLTGEQGINGISFAYSEVALRHVTDGASNTFLLGEKFIDAGQYDTGWARHDYMAWMAGSIERGSLPPRRDVPQMGHWPYRSFSCFGSAHAVGLHMAYCDGSVRFVNYDMDLAAFQAAANRYDGTAQR